MKSRFHSQRDRSTTELMMTPMIDVVFLLLVFFLATSSFELVELLLPGGISDQGVAGGQAAATVPPEAIRDIHDCIARIVSDKNTPAGFAYLFNGAPTASRDALVQQLQALVAVQNDVPIIVHPDDEVPIGLAVDIYDQARAAGGLRVYFAARSQP